MRRHLILVAAMALVLGACGGGGSRSVETGASTTATTMPSTAGITDGSDATTATSAEPATSAPGGATTGPTAPGSTPRPPAATTKPGPCDVGPQSPPSRTLPADDATALAFAPDGRLFFAERGGTVRVFQNGATKQFARMSVSTSGERGLLGLAVSPDFARDHFVFTFSSDPDPSRQSVTRWTDCAGTGSTPKVIVTLPGGSTCCHKGGRIAFGPDGKLYVTLGDEHTPAAAQDTRDVRGKILRYNADGTIPADNPFGPGNPVWAYGFRNPFGIAISPTGQVAVTNNGPSGDAGSPGTGYDTVVASVVRGGGYQWPNCYGYSHPNRSGTCGAGQHEPDWSSERSTVVPTGATFVNSSGPPAYAGHLIFCTYSEGMKIFVPGEPHATVRQGPVDCKLDVKQGPDHALYFSDGGQIHRLAR